MQKGDTWELLLVPGAAQNPVYFLTSSFLYVGLVCSLKVCFTFEYLPKYLEARFVQRSVHVTCGPCSTEKSKLKLKLWRFNL